MDMQEFRGLLMAEVHRLLREAENSMNRGGHNDAKWYTARAAGVKWAVEALDDYTGVV